MLRSAGDRVTGKLAAVAVGNNRPTPPSSCGVSNPSSTHRMVACLVGEEHRASTEPLTRTIYARQVVALQRLKQQVNRVAETLARCCETLQKKKRDEQRRSKPPTRS